MGRLLMGIYYYGVVFNENVLICQTGNSDTKWKSVRGNLIIKENRNLNI
jgi:hypothetical protein